MATTSWKVTNSTSETKKNLVVIDAYVDAPSPTGFYYEQTLTLLQASSVQSFVNPGSFASIPLPDVHKDTSGTSLPYTFIIAVAETLSPVMAMTFKSDLSDLKDLEITDDTLKIIDKALEFQKNITAFPSSDLAKAFVVALNSTATDALKKFFDATNDYKTVTVDNLHLIQTYFKVLPYGWADGRNSTFVIYASDYKNNTETDRPIGKLSITNDWTKPLPVSVSDKFTAELETYDDKAKRKLVFKSGVFWDSITTDTPKIALAGSFIMPSQLTQDNSQDKIVAFVVGNINGYDAFGLEGGAPDNQDEEGGFYDLFKVHNFKDGVDLVMYFIGIGVGIAFLYQVFTFLKFLKNKGKTDDQLEREEATRKMKEYVNQNNEAIARLVNRQINIPAPAAIAGNQEAVRQRALELNTRQSRNNINDMINAQRTALEQMAGRYANNATRTAMDNIDTIQERVDDGGLADFANNLADTMQRMTQITDTIRAGVEHVGEGFAYDQRRAINDAMEIFERVRVQQEENARAREEFERNEDLEDVEVEDGVLIDR